MTERVGVRHLIVAVSVSIAFGLFGMALLAAGARWWMPASIVGPVSEGGWTSRSRAWFTTSGFSPPENDPDRDRSFVWAGRTAELVSPNLDRSQPYRLTVLATAGRPPGLPFPLLSLAVDGVVLGTIHISNEIEHVSVEIPRRHVAGASVTISASNTFVPGPQDMRSLGVIIYEISLTPASGHFWPTWYVMVCAGLAIMGCVAGLLLCGLRTPMVFVASAAVAVGLSWLLLQDGAFIGSYVERLVAIGTGIALSGAVLALLRWLWPPVGELSEWPVAAGLVLGASAAKLALFAHPQAIVGDAIFQVHRAMLVHAGTYFFTSVTPRPFFEFPYPIALYAIAQPFWHFFPSKLDLVWLLRALTVSADALVGMAIWAAALRQWNDRWTALLCVVLWLFALAPLQALSNANLTNAFGQAVFGVAMGVIVWNAAGRRTSLVGLLAVGGLLVVAFLSHFSTVLLGIPILGTAGVMLMAAARGHARRFGVWVLLVVLAAAAVSYGVYYSHFHDVYRATFAHVSSRQSDEQTQTKLVAPPAVKFQKWLDGTSDDYGLPSPPLLISAAIGLILILKQRLREAFTLVLVAWALVWGSFTTLEIFTPVELRINLAAAPVFVCLGAYALGALAARSRWGVILASAGTALIAWDGVRVWLTCVGLNLRW